MKRGHHKNLGVYEGNRYLWVGRERRGEKEEVCAVKEKEVKSFVRGIGPSLILFFQINS